MMITILSPDKQKVARIILFSAYSYPILRILNF